MNNNKITEFLSELVKIKEVADKSCGDADKLSKYMKLADKVKAYFKEHRHDHMNKELK